MITGESRISYANVFEPKETPSGDMKFSACIMIPKADKKSVTEVNKAIKAAIAKGLEDNKFPKTALKGLRLPMRDGDAEFKNGDRGAEFQGFWFLNASSKNAPGVVNAQLQPLMTADDFFSGCWARVDINMFPYNTRGNKGIGVGLNNVMKIKEDDRLDGRKSAEQAFADFASAEDSDGDDGLGDLE